jgi:hypothetical protein
MTLGVIAAVVEYEAYNGKNMGERYQGVLNNEPIAKEEINVYKQKDI